MHNKYLLIISIFVITACGGGGDQKKETQFYKKQQTVPQTLEVSIARVNFFLRLCKVWKGVEDERLL